MKTTTSFSNRLDESNGSIQVTHNNAMQTASQTTESPETAKKRLGLLAFLAVGADAVASFLKSKMEKAAAVVSQVGDSVLKSKQAVSAAAAAVLVRIRPEPPKKARFASVPLFALMAVFFLASPTGMATGPQIYWTPSYDEVRFTRTAPTQIGPFSIVSNDPIYIKRYSFSSEKTPPSWSVAGYVSETYYTGNAPLTERIKTHHQTTYYSLGRVASYELWRNDASDKLRFRFTNNHLDLVHHKKVGKQTTISVSGRIQTKTVETWKNGLYALDTTWQSAGPSNTYFRTFFNASDSSRAYNDPAGYGMCESTRIAWPGPTVEITLCLPSNMSRPKNGYIEYEFWMHAEVSSSDNDE